jgi:hypothetical protein
MGFFTLLKQMFKKSPTLSCRSDVLKCNAIMHHKATQTTKGIFSKVVYGHTNQFILGLW